MRLRLMFAAVLVFVLAAPTVRAQSPDIDHQPVGCAVAERFPRLEARFLPAEAVAAARVVFQPENARHWYSVAMTPEGAAFAGVLPQPRRALKAFRYYIEVTDRALGTSRTANYSTTVVTNVAACQDKVVAGSLGSASVVVQAPEGAAAVPAGFSSTGVVAAAGAAAATGAAAVGAVAGAAGAGGGGVSATTIAIVGAAVGGAAVAATQLGGQDSDDVVDTFNGPVNGQITLDSSFTNTLGQTSFCARTQTITGSMQIHLRPDGTGRADVDLRVTEIAVTGNCTLDPTPRPISFGPEGAPVTGGPSAITFTQTGADTLATHPRRFIGSLTGNQINGTLTLEVVPLPGANPRLNGSTSIPVTLTGPRP